jgi:hypothetical protein
LIRKGLAVRVFFVVLVISLTILGAGCGGGGKQKNENGRITGTITFGRASSAVAGATVIAIKEDGTELARTKTGNDGKYSLLVEPGTKVDLIASKEGFAGSRFQGILLSAKGVFRADMIMQPRHLYG